MDVTLHAHDAKFYPLPQGLKELSSDITREVLRCQPTEIYKFIANYLNAVLLTREKAREAAIIVKDILEHDITYEAMLQRRGVSLALANRAATIIQAAYRGYVERKLFSGRVWLSTGFDLLAYLQARGLTPEQAAYYVTKIQSCYRGHVVRNIMRRTFKFATGEDDRPESGKVLEQYLITTGVDDDAASLIAQNVIFRYSEMTIKTADEGTDADETEQRDADDETEEEAEDSFAEKPAVTAGEGDHSDVAKESSTIVVKKESSMKQTVDRAASQPIVEAVKEESHEPSPPNSAEEKAVEEKAAEEKAAKEKAAAEKAAEEKAAGEEVAVEAPAAEEPAAE